MPLGDGGLISTARDYGKFLRCLLQKGKPLISEATHQSMVTNQIGELTIQTQPAANKAWAHPFPKGVGVDKGEVGFPESHGTGSMYEEPRQLQLVRSA